MKKIKQQNAITLIALIITIIILLILAVVTIRSLKDDRITIYAQNAATEYKNGQEEEQIMLGYSEYKIASINNPNEQLNVQGATVIRNGNFGWEVKFESGNNYYISKDGEISTDYTPVVNQKPTEWTIAYVYNGTTWTKYTETDKLEGGNAEGGIIEGQIVAKFYKENVPVEGGNAMLPSGIIPALAKEYSYELYIEGTGNCQMPMLVDINNEIGYGYNEELNESIQNNDCSNILIPYVTKIKVCEGVTNIGGFAFVNAINLEKVEIAKTVRTIDTYAFLNCSKLTEVIIPYGVEIIGSYAFQYAGIKKVEFPETLKMIQEHAFQYCNELEEVVIPNSVNEIGYRAFGDCSSLSKVYIESDSEQLKIGDYVFGGEHFLAEIFVKNSSIENIIKASGNYYNLIFRYDW